MDAEQIFAIRDLSESYKAFKAKKVTSCIWVTHEGEMFRKTVIKRLAKYLPKTDKWEHINQAIEIDNEDYIISTGQEDYLISLLGTTGYDDEMKDRLRMEIQGGMTQNGFSRIKKNIIKT